VFGGERRRRSAFVSCYKTARQNPHVPTTLDNGFWLPRFPAGKFIFAAIDVREQPLSLPAFRGDSGVPEAELLALIRTGIRSVWALELLLLMKRQPDRVWTKAALVQELRASTTLVQDNLGLLNAAGLIREESQGFVYGPATAALAQSVDDLEAAYRQRPVSVVNLIVGTSVDNVQGVADAFRFRRGED
jgi:hypothetical protein